MDSEEIQKAMSHALNCGRHQFTKEFAAELVRDHPTLQQDFWRFVQDVAQFYEHNGHTDGRNKASKEFVKLLNELTINQSLNLPFI